MAFLPLTARPILRALFLLVASAAVGYAQETPRPSPAESPTPAPRSVPIRFVPPPLEGTISLGVFDANGKLVRVLQREADFDEFEIGSDALSTTWDGNDDAGAPLPTGKYHARGYVVGDIAVDGIGFFFNDWVTDADSPHLRAIHNLKLVREKELALLVTLAGGQEGSASCDLSGELFGRVETEREDERFLPERYAVRAAEGRLVFPHAEESQPVAWPHLIAPLSAAAGKDGTVWVIDRAETDVDGLALKQFSPDGTFLRQMLFAVDEPQPRVVAASTTSDRIFLLEENAAQQRLRGLTLVATNVAADPAAKPVSDWKVEFEKHIVAHQRFAIVGGQPVLAPDPAEVSAVTIKLRSNPLEKGASATVELAVDSDEDGSFLKTGDGLPLQTVSETPHLTRIVLAPNGVNAIDVFQDDEAVVEHFRVTALDQMMAFDCGEIELK